MRPPAAPQATAPEAQPQQPHAQQMQQKQQQPTTMPPPPPQPPSQQGAKKQQAKKAPMQFRYGMPHVLHQGELLLF